MGKRLEYRYGIIQEKLDSLFEIGGHHDLPGAEIFRIDMFDEPATIDCNLDVFDGGALADVWHELIQLGLVERLAGGPVEPQPHLSKKVVVVQIMEEVVSQNIHPVPVGTVE